MKPVFFSKDGLLFWARRYRLRLRILALLLAMLAFVSAVDFFFEQILFSSPALRQGPLKVTEKHFRRPENSLWKGENWGRFLDHAIEGKPGWLGEKWFYILLLILYAWLAGIVFCRLTPPDNSLFSGRREAGKESSASENPER